MIQISCETDELQSNSFVNYIYRISLSQYVLLFGFSKVLMQVVLFFSGSKQRPN